MNMRKFIGMTERAICVVAAIYFASSGNWDAGTFFCTLGIFSTVTRYNEK